MTSHAYKSFFLKMDSGLRYALGTRVWQALSSCILLFLILKGTQPSEQGIYYTVASLANLQIFFELGLSFVILQSTPHYFQTLTWGQRGALLGPEPGLATLLAFVQKSIWIYVVLSGLFMLIMIPLGLVFFRVKHDLHGLTLPIAWVLLVLGMAVNLLCSPWLAVLEGSGKVSEVYCLRLKQLVVANILAWIVFFFTDALCIIVVNTWITALTTVGWLLSTHRPFLRMVASALFQRLSFSWHKEIWPMQWRIAVSWISGYFLNQIFTPVLYYYKGAVVSGQMGICLSLAMMLGLFSITWLTVRSPKMGELVAQADRKKLDQVFFSAFWQSIFIFILGALGILGLGFFLREHAIMTRFLPWSEMALLLLGYLFVHIIGGLSLYLRAHRIELFMPLSVTGAALIATSAWFGAVYYGSLGVVWSILTVNACYGFPSAWWLWFKFKQKWRDNNGQRDNESKTYNQYPNVEPS